jgi:TrmH family RNA methyltransferase
MGVDGRLRRMGSGAAYTRGMASGAPITSRSNARVKALRASFSGKAARPGELLGLEGEHLIVEALRSGLGFETVFVREGSEAVLERAGLEGLRAGELVVLSADVFGSAVDTASPQGIAATIVLPAPVVAAEGDGPVLVLEDLQDPGNLGTLLRSAEAFGARQVMVTLGTVSVWNPKVVRASAGSVFRVPVQRATMSEIAGWLREQEIELYAAVLHDATSVLEARLRSRCALMIGNEGAGLSAEALGLAQHRVRIPCAVESLNAAVAGSTLLYEAMRQREGSR